MHQRVLTIERVFDSTLTVLMDKGVVTQEEIQTQIYKDSEAYDA